MESVDSGVQHVVAILEEIVSILRKDCAVLQVERTRNHDGTIVRLIPSESKCSPFSVHLEDKNTTLADVSFGIGTTIEVPSEIGWASEVNWEQILELVKEMAMAVTAGDCEEHLGFVSVRGTLRLKGGLLTSVTSFHFRLFPRTVRYRAYGTSALPRIAG